ncbi:hypothetical protein BU24DRAFT_226762 [Aaosphaeria arxii CBS 175.79]|uniref:Uncharacterized protein n=1 Tax=Aaosphaeria arxii CBS 175.79 TaxID=1450172 RepID=A0A6A5XP25_9PLEO|nr:uncharacterized protein BU24DRAFT_226762 [Aaosphaeria arxii CBS 175.79]KAF2015015.1 hypothetical protein BU24DRAFT_226762 [Aaosphaeria arxii CBS 175.79]
MGRSCRTQPHFPIQLPRTDPKYTRLVCLISSSVPLSSPTAQSCAPSSHCICPLSRPSSPKTPTLTHLVSSHPLSLSLSSSQFTLTTLLHFCHSHINSLSRSLPLVLASFVPSYINLPQSGLITALLPPSHPLPPPPPPPPPSSPSSRLLLFPSFSSPTEHHPSPVS